MQHESQGEEIYPSLSCEPMSLQVIRNEGRVQTKSGAIIPFADALGPTPKNPEALHALLAHPKADEIKTAFNLAEPIPEIFGEGDAIPLTDVWPGLKSYLPDHRKRCCIIPCE